MKMGKYKVKVTASALYYRSGPSTSYKSRGLINKGAEYTSSKQSKGWYWIDSKNGWSSGKYLKVTQNLNSSKKSKKSTTKKVKTKKKSAGLDKKMLDAIIASLAVNNRKLDASMRLFGGPHQFTRMTDTRFDDGKYTLGRKYIESIVAESPIVYFLPGRPSYLPGVSSAERDAMENFFMHQADNSETASTINKILGTKDIRYFDFLADYSTYMKYVNLLCRTSAIYMGLGDKKCPVDGLGDTPYKFFNWSNYRYEDSFSVNTDKHTSVFNIGEKLAQNAYDALFGSYQYTQFYVDPQSSFTESIGNQTAESRIAGMFRSGEQLLKEFQFVTNSVGGSAAGNMQDMANGFQDTMQQMDGKGLGGFFQKLGSLGSSVVAGSNIIFPEIWGDASYGKSYNFSINLTSPYGTAESIYLNVIVPLMHIMALALPRQTTANSYTNPFIVKASCKGWFSCEMGIIDSISIEKVQGSYSASGLPTEIKVQVGLKDLYSNLMMSPSTKPQLFFENQGLMNWLAVTCGLDVTKPNAWEKLNAMGMTLLSKFRDIPNNVYLDVLDEVRSGIDHFLSL